MDQLTPEEIAAKDLPTFARAAVELERLARGEETRQSRSTFENAPNVSVALKFGNQPMAWLSPQPATIDVQPKQVDGKPTLAERIDQPTKTRGSK